MCDTWVTWFTGIWLLQGQPFVLSVFVFPSSFRKWFAQINIQAAAQKAKAWDVDEWPCFASLEIGLELESVILAWLMALKCRGVQTHPLFWFLFLIPCPHFPSLSSSQRSCPQTDFDILNYLKLWYYSRLKVSADVMMHRAVRPKHVHWWKNLIKGEIIPYPFLVCTTKYHPGHDGSRKEHTLQQVLLAKRPLLDRQQHP